MKRIRPHCNSHGFTLPSYAVIPSLIIALFLFGSPIAIFGMVSTLIVPSFERLSVRPVPHVFVKVFKLSPPVTNRDSSTAVIFKCARLRVVATLYHGSPNSVNWLLIHSMFCGLRLHSGCRILPCEATTTRCSRTQIPTPDIQYISA